MPGWLGPGSRLRSALYALGCVLAVAVLVWVLEDAGVLPVFSERAADGFMPQQLGGAARPTRARPIVLIDIDAATERVWGAQPVLRRDNLAKLIDFAALRGPRAIILDVPLVWPGPGNDALTAFLRSYQPDARRARLPPLILAQSPEEEAVTTSLRRALAQDPAIKTNGMILWGAPLFSEDPDMVVRYWRLWEADCGHAEAIPSVPLLVLSLDREATARPLLDRLAQLARDGCADAGKPLAYTPMDFGETELDLAQGTTLAAARQNLRSRILYTMSRASAGGPIVPASVAGGTAPLLTIVPAHKLVGDAAPDVPSTGALDGSIVVIGADGVLDRDAYPSPVGRLSGALVLANAVNTMMQYGRLGPPPAALRILAGVLIGMIVWACLEFLAFPAGLALAALLIWAAGFLFSGLWATTGMWWDALLPSLGALLHRAVASAAEAMGGGRGWRAILRRRPVPSPAIAAAPPDMRDRRRG